MIFSAEMLDWLDDCEWAIPVDQNAKDPQSLYGY